MKLKFWRSLFSLLMILSLGLAGCSQGSSASGSLMKVKADNCSYGGEILSVEALDQSTVKFTLCSPDAAFPEKMTSPIFAVQDKDYLDSHKGDSALLTAEVNGTGPFAVAVNDPALPLRLSVSPTYWGTPPRLTDLFFHWYKDTDVTIPRQYRSMGDVFNTIKPTALNSIETDPAFIGIKHDSLNLVYIGFNNTVAPLDKVEVRKAIASAVNTSYLAQQYLLSGSETASQMIPSYARTGRSKNLDWYLVRPKDATDALNSIGYDFDQEITLSYVSGPIKFLQSPGQMASEIQTELAAIKIKVVLKPMSLADFDKAMADGTEMMFIDSFEALYNDGAAFYEWPIIRETKRFGNPYETLQQDFQGAQSEPSVTSRQEKFDILNQDFKDLVPLIPVGHVPQWSYFRSSINSASTNAYFENYEDLSSQALALHIYEASRPPSLWPADETDYDTFRITKLLYDTLVTEGYGTSGLQSSLADSWTSNTAMTEWTFYLRYNVKFTNGAALDANDVVASFAAIWDASSVNHVGRIGEYKIFKTLFGNLINQ
jgi:ABC-type transport system substrate-binding protein